MMKSHFGRRVVSDIGDTIANTDRPSSMGKTHEYLVSPSLSKVRLFTRDIHVVVIYPMGWPFWNGLNPTYQMRNAFDNIAGDIGRNFIL